MKNTGTLRIQTFAARQSAPVEGVTVAVQGDGFTLHCITDATGSAADIPVEAPACALSLDEDNTTRPYAIVSLTAAKPGYRTVRIEGIQIFAGQVTLAQPQMLPVTEEDRDIPNAPIIIPPHALFAGSDEGTTSFLKICHLLAPIDFKSSILFSSVAIKPFSIFKIATISPIRIVMNTMGLLPVPHQMMIKGPSAIFGSAFKTTRYGSEILRKTSLHQSSSAIRYPATTAMKKPKSVSQSVVPT